jgi:hypothetical protein
VTLSPTALDARLVNYRIRQWRNEGLSLVSQRGFMDNFIFGAAQGISYCDTERLLQTTELERPTAQIFLIADPSIAFERIARASERDKYETPEFLARQHAETIGFLDAITGNDRELAAFAGIPTTLIDTTSLTPDETLTAARQFVREAIPAQ